MMVMLEPNQIEISVVNEIEILSQFLLMGTGNIAGELARTGV